MSAVFAFVAAWWPILLLAWLFGAALCVGFFRVAAAAEREQERHLADIEQRLAARRADDARCPWPLKNTPFHARETAGEEQQSAA